MNIQRTITIRLPDDQDLRDTLARFQALQNQLSPLCYNGGKAVGALQLQREHYHAVKGVLSSQMTIMAMRLVSGAYVAAKKGHQRRLKAEARRKAKYERKGWDYRPRIIKEPGVCQFERLAAMFLVGSRGRDASFLKNNTVSLWTTGGRKHLAYTVPAAFQETLAQASEVDSVTVIERHGKLLGRVVLTLEVPEPKAVHPIGVDLNETNAVVAVDPDGQTLFISGRHIKVRNKRTRKTRKRLQGRLASRKAQKKDSRSLRRLLKRQGRRNSNRTRTFAQTAARRLCDWAAAESVLVFEALAVPQPAKETVGAKDKAKGKSLRRRLSAWQYGLIRQCVQNRAERVGLAVAEVDPSYTSQNCSRCGLRGGRKRHKFECPHCGFLEHADINAACNIRDRFTVLRDGHSAVRQDTHFAVPRHGGPPSIGPVPHCGTLEALESAPGVEDEGKPSASADGN